MSALLPDMGTTANANARPSTGTSGGSPPLSTSNRVPVRIGQPSIVITNSRNNINLLAGTAGSLSERPTPTTNTATVPISSVTTNKAIMSLTQREICYYQRAKRIPVAIPLHYEYIPDDSSSSSESDGDNDEEDDESSQSGRGAPQSRRNHNSNNNHSSRAHRHTRRAAPKNSVVFYCPSFSEEEKAFMRAQFLRQYQRQMHEERGCPCIVVIEEKEAEYRDISAGDESGGNSLGASENSGLLSTMAIQLKEYVSQVWALRVQQMITAEDNGIVITNDDVHGGAGDGEKHVVFDDAHATPADGVLGSTRQTSVTADSNQRYYEYFFQKLKGKFRKRGADKPTETQSTTANRGGVGESLSNANNNKGGGSNSSTAERLEWCTNGEQFTYFPVMGWPLYMKSAEKKIARGYSAQKIHYQTNAAGVLTMLNHTNTNHNNNNNNNNNNSGNPFGSLRKRKDGRRNTHFADNIPETKSSAMLKRNSSTNNLNSFSYDYRLESLPPITYQMISCSPLLLTEQELNSVFFKLHGGLQLRQSYEDVYGEGFTYRHNPANNNIKYYYYRGLEAALEASRREAIMAERKRREIQEKGNDENESDSDDDEGDSNDSHLTAGVPKEGKEGEETKKGNTKNAARQDVDDSTIIRRSRRHDENATTTTAAADDRSGEYTSLNSTHNTDNSNIYSGTVRSELPVPVLTSWDRNSNIPASNPLTTRSGRNSSAKRSHPNSAASHHSHTANNHNSDNDVSLPSLTAMDSADRRENNSSKIHLPVFQDKRRWSAKGSSNNNNNNNNNNINSGINNLSTPNHSLNSPTATRNTMAPPSSVRSKATTSIYLNDNNELVNPINELNLLLLLNEAAESSQLNGSNNQRANTAGAGGDSEHEGEVGDIPYQYNSQYDLMREQTFDIPLHDVFETFSPLVTSEGSNHRFPTAPPITDDDDGDLAVNSDVKRDARSVSGSVSGSRSMSEALLSIRNRSRVYSSDGKTLGISNQSIHAAMNSAGGDGDRTSSQANGVTPVARSATPGDSHADNQHREGDKAKSPVRSSSVDNSSRGSRDSSAVSSSSSSSSNCEALQESGIGTQDAATANENGAL